MLGNDIVDLQKASLESNWRRKGYLNKLFTADEQEQILTSTNPEITVWLFWSMKEAAYKIVNRETEERFYNPKRFSCKFNGNNGLVNFEDKIVHTKSLINLDFIHTIASITSQDLGSIQTTYFENTHNYLSDFNSNSKHYVLEKDIYGVPNLVDKINGKKHFASISHHGKYLAIVSFVIEKKND
ncbi:4'-phosphopantetheinyl transferase family protein [Pedobacter boryungensis]|uniref:4-phosphopantetheinyl transferase family protein n=1 Tax=Pedobacter boryungensis TaxID=869962 RepID=A0ABX2DF17_9SPHI|nr:4'-phosphopantetheinyl transferase superfamily protein [Pedobacter boryungensis]NQX32575.1 4-phosphopantetheinyl transferase family protein [Pedobacter boryungensis]